MIKKISPSERMLLLSILFNMSLLFVRFYYTKELMYGFYIWNTFLAILPLLFSRILLRLDKCNFKAMLLVICWLAFFPNAPYMITDVFHYTERPPVPQWYDLIVVITAVWNGLLSGIISLMQIEQFLSRHFRIIWVKIIVIVSFILCGYGVYIGRYLRFNSWDVVMNPKILLYTFAGHVLKPQEHTMTWAFTILFATMFGIIYFTLRQLKVKQISVDLIN